MTYSQSIFLSIFAVLAYIFIVDGNVPIYIVLVFKTIKINIERKVWMFVYHPNNFITTWIQNRKYDKIARELQKEFESKNK